MKRLIGLAVLACLLLAGCGADVPETPNAFEYKVVEARTEKRHAISRTRHHISVVPAGSPELNQKSLADTAIRVALDKAEETGADVIFVNVYQSRDIFHDKLFTPLAQCTYVPDGKGIGGEGDLTWDVVAAQERVPLQIINMKRLWDAERSKFVYPKEFIINGKKFVDDKYLDEEKLIAHLSQMTNVPEDKVTINHFKAFASKYFEQ